MISNSNVAVRARCVTFAWCALSLFSISAAAQQQSSPTESGALQVFVVHFSLGDSWDSSLAATEQKNFRQHSENLNRLRSEGNILFGARYADVGMIFLQATSLDAAVEILQQDPGVAAGIFKFSIEPVNIFYPWLE